MIFGNKYSRIILASALDGVRALNEDVRVAQERDTRKLFVSETGDVRVSQRDGRACGNGDFLAALKPAGQHVAALRFVAAGQRAEIDDVLIKVLVSLLGIPIQRLGNGLQVYVLRAAVEGFMAVVHRAVGDGAEFGVSLFDRDGIAVLQLRRRDIADTRDLRFTVSDRFHDALFSFFINAGEGQLVRVREVERERRLGFQRERRADKGNI